MNPCLHGGAWAASVGASITYLKVSRTAFPCVMPHMAYAIALDGKVELAGGFHSLAFQGLQKKEVEHFKLAEVAEGLLRDLAGNAFTANILTAFVLAAAALSHWGRTGTNTGPRAPVTNAKQQTQVFLSGECKEGSSERSQ